MAQYKSASIIQLFKFNKRGEKMFEIHGNNIGITKGDSATINVILRNNDGSIYEMQSGDTLTMTVRKTPEAEVLLQEVSTTNTITLTPQKTRNLVAGECCFDIQLDTASGGVFTVVGLKNQRSNMVVWNEVTV